jgi:hypothetical protein
MNFRTLLGGNTVASPTELAAMIEAEEGYGRNNNLSGLVYDDRAAPYNGNPGHNPTIGYGLNLRVAANMALVLNQIQINGTNIFTQAANSATPQDIQTVVSAFA